MFSDPRWGPRTWCLVVALVVGSTGAAPADDTPSRTRDNGKRVRRAVALHDEPVDRGALVELRGARRPAPRATVLVLAERVDAQPAQAHLDAMASQALTLSVVTDTRGALPLTGNVSLYLTLTKSRSRELRVGVKGGRLVLTGTF